MATPVTMTGVVSDLKTATVPALRDLAVASAGFALTNYGGSALLGRQSQFTQGLAQGAVGVLAMVAARRARIPLLETAGFGAGMSGMVKILYGVLSHAASVKGTE